MSKASFIPTALLELDDVNGAGLSAGDMLLWDGSEFGRLATDGFGRVLLQKQNAGQVRSYIGLDQVNNTSDADKPVSTATQTALNGKADLVGGVVPSAQIPAIAVTTKLASVGSQAAMLALSGQEGDWTIRTDLGTTWVITGSNPTQLSSWTALSYPTAPVISVNGQTGAITLNYTDIGLGTAALQNIGASGANVPLLNGSNTWTGTQTMPVIDVGGSVYHAASYPGATLGAKIQAAHEDMPAQGGVIDCRGRSLSSAQSITSTITLTKPTRIIFGNHTIAVSAGIAINGATTVVLEGAGTGSTLTLNGCDFVSWSGNYAQNKNNLRITSLNFVGGTGRPHIVYDGRTFPSVLNFNESLFRFESCRVSGFNADFPIRLGASFYYNFIHWNNFNSNTYALYSDRYSDLSFSHNSGASMGLLMTNGCNARITDNTWGDAGQTTADIWVNAGSNGADGMVFMSNNKHGPEGDTYTRYKIVICAADMLNVTDAVVTSGQAVVTSAAGGFTASHVGKAVLSALFPAGTTVLSRQSANQVTMSANATASLNPAILNIAVPINYVIPDVSIVNGKFYAAVDQETFGQKAIDIESPVRSLRVIGSTFDGFAYVFNDAQPTSTAKSGGGVFMGNSVINASTASFPGSVSRVFVNGGRGFSYCDDDIHANAIPPRQPLRDAPYLSNRVPYSDDFNSWTKSGVTVTSGQADPLGGTTASLLTRAGSSISENVHIAITVDAVGSVAAIQSGAPVTQSIYLKGGNTGSAEIGLYDTTDGAFVWQDVVPLSSTAWKRVSVPIGGLVNGHNYGFYIYPGSSTTPEVASTIYAWHAQASDYDSDFLPTTGSAASNIAVGNRLERGVTYTNAPVGVVFTSTITGVSLIAADGTTTTFFTVPAGRTFVATALYVMPTTITSYNSAAPPTFNAVESGSGNSLTNVNTGSTGFSTTGKVVLETPSTGGGSFTAAAGTNVQFKLVTHNTSTAFVVSATIVGFYIS